MHFPPKPYPPFFGIYSLTALMVALFFSYKADAADWSESFFLAGPNGTVCALVEDDQYLYLGGDFTAIGNLAVSHVARVSKATGEVSAMGSGLAASNAFVLSQTVRCMANFNGEIWVAGDFSSAGGAADTAGIAKWNGVNWETVGAFTGLLVPLPGSKVNVMHATTGAIYLGGEFQSINNVPGTRNCAVWDGSTWSGIGSEIEGRITAILKTDSGLYLGGWFRVPGNVDFFHFAKWTGSAWTETQTDIEISQPSSLAVLNGQVLIGMTNLTYVGSNVIRWDGSEHESLGESRRNEVLTLASQGGNVYAGGVPYDFTDYTSPLDAADAPFAVYNGASWSIPDGGVEGTVHAVLASGANVYVAGEFMKAGGKAITRIARLTAGKWHPVISTSSGAGVHGRVLAVLDAGDVVYIGGDFTVAGGVLANRVASWNKATRQWSAFGAGMTGTYINGPPEVRCLAFLNGQLYAGGRFKYAGSVQCDDIARWDGTAWRSMGGGTGGDQPVNALLVKGSDVYAAGQFSQMGGVFHANVIARWNGSQWSPVGSHFDDFSNHHDFKIHALCLWNGQIVVGGENSSDPSRFLLGAWNGSSWNMVGDGGPFPNIPSLPITALAVFDDVIHFGTSQGVHVWDGSTYPQSTAVTRFFDHVTALTVRDDGLYMASSQTIATQPFMSVSRWDGDTWSEFLEEAPGIIYSMASNGPDMHLGGDFTEVGGVRSHNFASMTDGEPPELVVENAGSEVSDGSLWNMGSAGAKEFKDLSFTVRNTGAGGLYANLAFHPASDTASFTLATRPSFPLNPGGSTSFTVRFAPQTGGPKQATLRLSSNTPGTPVFEILLIGQSIIPTPPKTKTLPAADITHDSAILHGLVHASGVERDVFFDYGLEKNPDLTVAATPASVGADSAESGVEALVTGLAPHTKYYFRSRAVSTLGSASGAILSFTTANRAPTATDDNFLVSPSVAALLEVTLNDEDPDGDVLALAKLGKVSPASAGKLAKSGGNLIFTPSKDFTTATFTYSVKDSFGGGSNFATVTLSQGSADFTPKSLSLPSAGGDCPISIQSDAHWSIVEKLSWVSASRVFGSGDATITLTLQPNTSKNPRMGEVLIAGQPLQITQAGVLKPSLAPPAVIEPGIVGASYTLLIPTANLPVKYTARGLPPGLSLDDNTGLLAGIPTQGGSFPVVITADNAAAKADETLELTLEILPLADNQTGIFQGIVSRHPTLNANLASRLQLFIAPTGALTGKLITGKSSQSFKGILSGNLEDPSLAGALISIPRSKDTTLTLDVTVRDDGTLTGFLEKDAETKSDVDAWRIPWSKDHRVPQDLLRPHHFSLAQPDTDPAFPQGFGFGSFPAMKDTTGALTISGRLADGSGITQSCSLGMDGRLQLYQTLYQNTGSLAGWMVLDNDGTISGSPSWSKAPVSEKSKDRLYREGFAPLPLTAEGGAYLGVSPGGLMLGLPGPEATAHLAFASGGLASPGFFQNLSLSNPSAKSTNNQVLLHTPVLHSLKVSKIKPVTGTFSGEFIGNATPGRKAIFHGLIIPVADELVGRGFFHLPETPAKTSPIHSGSMLLAPGTAVVPAP